MTNALKIGLLTAEKYPHMVPDEQALVSAFKQQGVVVVPLVWTRSHQWSEFQAVIIRNPWDYFELRSHFLTVLSEIAQSTKLFNPLNVVKWNLDKHYLFELKHLGIEIPPSFEIASADELLNHLKQDANDLFVIKPFVSAGASNTYIFDKLNPPLDLFHHSSQKSWLLQHCLKEVIHDGEYSYIYLGGRFSHAILKKPRSGDFRVQEEHGGSVKAYKPSAKELEETDQIYQKLGRDLLYARIDLVRVETRPVVMEVELIEPELFFRFNPEAGEKLVRSLLSRLVR